MEKAIYWFFLPQTVPLDPIYGFHSKHWLNEQYTKNFPMGPYYTAHFNLHSIFDDLFE